VSSDVARLIRWMHRAAPPRRALVEALFAGTVASLLNTALLVGAVALLVQSSTRPGLHAVLGVLIVIELLAFLRSPLRFAERMSAHRLGYAAVSHWRRWLVTTVGRWNFSKWRTYATGDLLERSLGDTDELQDLWLRFFLPLVTTTVVVLTGDVVVVLVPAHGHWWATAAVLLAAQLIGVAALVVNLAPLLRCDRALRRARSNYLAQLIELSSVAPDLMLLGRESYVLNRSQDAVSQLGHAESSLHRQHQASNVAIFCTSILALGALLVRPPSLPVWTVTVVMIIFATYELLQAVRSALNTAINVSAGAERLEQLDDARGHGDHLWPRDTTLRLDHAAVIEDGTALVLDGELFVAPGRRVALTGESGSGKSTLLRALAGLDTIESGSITVGHTELMEIDESNLRWHLAYVPSEPGLMRGYAVDVLQLGRTGIRNAHRDLASLGIQSDATTRWDQLSRGERARIAIARALLTSPHIILLDEPTSGLGAMETAAVLDLIAETRATVIVATHDQQVIDWCDDVVELRGATLRMFNR
jgi:ABC-type transport system involved in cytochrome bd biosynthesis fused ATPase/permease subunit